ncbi:hypothetical protein ACPYPG_17585 [Streptomyces sp. FR-108]
MPHTARVPWVRHLSQPFQQARHLPGPDAGLLAELVKSRRNRQ